MKKSIFILAALFVSIAASAQLSFGLKGGLNITNMSLSTEELMKAENKTGWFIGPTVKLNVPIINIGVDASILYDQREAKLETETIKHQAINIPINARYGWGLGEMAELFVKAGPQFGFNVGDKNIIKDVDEFQWKDTEFSVNLGAGLMLLSKLEVAANYNIIVGKTGELEPKLGSFRCRSNAWQVSAAYYF